MIQTFRLGVVILAGLLLPAIARAEEPTHPLVNLAKLANPPLLDIRYATEYNFTGKQLYPAPFAWLHPDAVEALVKVQNDLRSQGLGLLVFDAYRPPAIQQTMWDLVQDERYVSNPAVNLGRHTRGTAVDVTLTDLMGNPLPMPSGFDDFSEKAHRDFAGGTAEQRANRQLLQEVMERHGLIGYTTEWWHFDLKDWENHPVLHIDPNSLVAD